MARTELAVETFRLGSDKEAALKPLEEAAEVFGAYQRYKEVGPDRPIEEAHRLADLADEIADVIQASCNLAARYRIDLSDAMERCRRRNVARGRYEDTWGWEDQ